MLLCQTRWSVAQACLRATRPRAFSSENNLPLPSSALTLLHKVTTLLPRALRTEVKADFWNAILSNTYEDLSATTTTKRPAKIVGSCAPTVVIEGSIDYLWPFQSVA